MLYSCNNKTLTINRAVYWDTPWVAPALCFIIVQGGKDTAVPATYTRQWIDAMKEIGMKHKYMELAGAITAR